MEQTIYTVSQINACLKDLLEGDLRFRRVLIRGELSNYKIYPSGHHYFTLKDGGSALKCVMFRSSAMRLRFRPQDGMKVICGGQISVYERDGVYQLYCSQITPEGAGDLYLAFEQLKKKLLQEGMFDETRKKPLPKYPHRIVLITSPAGAAIRDMLRIIGARYPLAEVFLIPVHVQGNEAPGDLCRAIEFANRGKLGDVILMGRGGGSIEDLWSFNEESVARAISASRIPVVSAVGHEPDVTISDFVADLRAATPSNGAELITPDRMDLQRSLVDAKARLLTAMDRILRVERKRLALLQSSRALQSPKNILDDRRQRLDSQLKLLATYTLARIDAEKQRFIRLSAGLDAMSPIKVLSRGYSVTRKSDGTLLTSVAEAKSGEMICVQLKDGTLDAVVGNVERGAK